ncbi:MAG: NAD(P)-binding domain-containing protein [Verrucomicrobia bacterium]|nr:NAD(P)-binding domain-containing protein [Verrucomicrobiota bacterium]
MTKYNSLTHQVVIVGAGPYGLAAAAHLRAAQVETCVFGEPMEFWESQMPEGMLLRSSWDASHIADPHRSATLDAYSASQHSAVPKPVPLDRFVGYGRWFQNRVVPDLDRRRVGGIEVAGKGFRVVLHDGDSVQAQRVVIAAGIAPFARRPPQFTGIPAALASHASEHREMKRFAGRRVIVVGSGQSALESAALLHELGAEVEVIARQRQVHWLDQRARWLKSKRNPIRPLLYPSTDVGPPGLNWIVATPDLFRRLPRPLQEKIAYRSIRPAGAGWLVPRVRGVRITIGAMVSSATRAGDSIRLALSDGTSRCVDHVMLATGYQVDVSRYPFLKPELVRALRLNDGYPELREGFESTVPGLHFLGAPAARSFGPLCRFVAGTPFAARSLTRRILGTNGFHQNGF